MNAWNLRHEVFALAHRWHWIVASFLLGALFGWLSSLIWPAPYRATLDLYVGLNAYRAPLDQYIALAADEEFRSLDDYKNWQMRQLNALVFSDVYLTETLARLQAQDPFWQSVDVPALHAMLTVAWRNTGEWHFSAQASQPNRAQQAVTIWSQVVIEKTTEAVAAAREMVIIDSRMRAAAQSQAELETRQLLLQATNLTLADWMNYFASQAPDTSLTPGEHWALLSQVTTAAALDLSWLPVLDSAPPLGSPISAYQAWLPKVIALIESELAVLPPQITALEAQHAELAAVYQQFASQSRALSATLEVQQIVDQPPQVEHLRPTETLLLIGGALGLLVWGFFWMVQITRKTS